MARGERGPAAGAARRPRGGVDRSPRAARRRAQPAHRALGFPRARDREPSGPARRAAHERPAQRAAPAGPRPHRPRGRPARPHRPQGLVVLGGRLPPALDAHLRSHGALVFPTDPQAPVNPYRATLYSAARAVCRAGRARLRGDPRRAGVPRGRATRGPARRVRHPAAGDPRRLGHRCPRRVRRRPPTVGVMGGHALAPRHHRVRRCRPPRSPARDRGPRRWRPVAGRARWRPPTSVPSPQTRRRWAPRSSGSPSRAPRSARHRRVGRLALAVRDHVLGADGGRAAGGETRHAAGLGIPTWFYGHEPPNVFCDGIAQVLLQRAPRGGPAGPRRPPGWSCSRALRARCRRSSRR